MIVGVSLTMRSFQEGETWGNNSTVCSSNKMATITSRSLVFIPSKPKKHLMNDDRPSTDCKDSTNTSTSIRNASFRTPGLETPRSYSSLLFPKWIMKEFSNKRTQVCYQLRTGPYLERLRPPFTRPSILISPPAASIRAFSVNTDQWQPMPWSINLQGKNTSLLHLKPPEAN